MLAALVAKDNDSLVGVQTARTPPKFSGPAFSDSAFLSVALTASPQMQPAPLRTRDKHEAAALLNARNESFRQASLNVQLARAYLTASDPAMRSRTWQTVMNEMQTHGKPATQLRCARAMQSRAFAGLRDQPVIETRAEDFLQILHGAKVSVNHYLRRLHNLALSLGWLAVPILAPKLWPKPQFKPKRGITAEPNPERNLFYQLLWEIGASQSDAAALTAESLDWATRTLTYFRMKTG